MSRSSFAAALSRGMVLLGMLPVATTVLIAAIRAHNVAYIVLGGFGVLAVVFIGVIFYLDAKLLEVRAEHIRLLQDEVARARIREAQQENRGLN